MKKMRAGPSIRAHLLLLSLFAALPMFGFAAYVSSLLVNQGLETTERAAVERARALMTAIDAELQGTFTSLDALATSRALDTGDLSSFHAEAMRVLDSQPAWLNIGLAQTDGRMLINAKVPYGQPVPVSVEPGSVELVVRTHKRSVGKVVPGNIVRTPVIPARVPVVRGGEVRYVLSAAVKPSIFEELIRRQNLPEGWVIGLVDIQGNFVARMPPREPGTPSSKAFQDAMRKGQTGWYRGFTVEGIDTFTAYHRSDFSNWTIGFAIPADFVFAGARRTLLILGGGALAAILIALLLAALLGRRISEPLMALADSARAIGQGHAAELPPATVREVGVVAAELSEAGSALRAQRERDEKEKEDLISADRAKDQFIAMMSHELRNPLAALSAAAQVLKVVPPGHDAAVNARAAIERQTGHMTRLIEDLLDINRIVMGKAPLTREVLDLAVLATEVVGSWRESGRFASRNIILKAAPVAVSGDQSRLEQVLANLLDNALKFSPVGKTIAVDVFRDGPDAVLRVADEGQGMEPAAIERMFELFVQGSQGIDRRTGGLGVGLALVRRLVELHGGSVVAQSDGLGKGSVFTVRVPASA